MTDSDPVLSTTVTVDGEGGCVATQLDGDGPRWLLPRGLIIVLGGAGTVVAVAGMQAFASILAPVFLALMLTVAVHPLLGRLRGRGWPVWLAVLATLLLAYSLILGVAASLALSVGQLATLLPTYEDRVADLLNQVTGQLAEWGIGAEQIHTALGGVDFAALAGLLGDLLAGLAGAFSNLLFILTVMLFMGVDAAQMPSRLRAIAGQRPSVVSALTSFARGTRSYLIVATVFGLIVAVIDSAALFVLGVPLALVWGLLSFITNYIPNIGFVIGLVPPALIALLEGGPILMLWVIIVYCVINVVIQEIIQPKFVSDAVDLSLTVTLLSVVFWTWVIGPLGALLAIPLTLLTKALLIDIDPDTRWMANLISTRPPATEPSDAAAASDAAATEDAAAAEEAVAEEAAPATVDSAAATGPPGDVTDVTR
jgi:predicted PurR-regulated permease PerM